MAKKKDPQLELERKSQIILTTFKLLIQESYHSVTLDKVAKSAGLSKGLVSYYFKNKDSLILETMYFFQNMHKQKILSIAHENSPPKKRLQRLVEAIFPSIEEVKSIVLFHIEIFSFAKSNPQAMEAVKNYYHEFQLSCSEVVQVGIEQGFICAKKGKAPYLDFLIHSIIEGVTIKLCWDKEYTIEKARKALVQFFDSYLTT